MKRTAGFGGPKIVGIGVRKALEYSRPRNKNN